MFDDMQSEDKARKQHLLENTRHKRHAVSYRRLNKHVDVPRPPMEKI
jgi:hypothetical protein